MSNQKYQKRPLIQEAPVIFPPLKKPILKLDDVINLKSSIDEIGQYAILLNKKFNKSIYKKLLIDHKNKDLFNSNLSYQDIKDIRNKYLKKLVESNPYYFPKELSLDEYKKRTISKEEKLNEISKSLEESAKREKINLSINSKNNSSNLNASRRESFLEEKRKRTESVDYQEIMKKNDKNNSDNLYENEEKQKDNNESQKIINIEENEDDNEYENENYANGNEEDDSQNLNYSEGGDGDDGQEY